MINSGDISVILQGPVIKNETLNSINSIKKILPQAQIIISTWEGNDVSDINVDKVIFSKDPGAELICKNVYNNVNRVLKSTQAGIIQADRKYILKMRSDLILSNTKFLETFDKYQKRNEKYKLFERKVIVPVLFTISKIKQEPILFHISDWYIFGLAEDVKLYFENTELVKEPEFTNYFPLDSKYKNARMKFTSEQYMCYSAFNRKFPEIYLKDKSDIDNNKIEQSRLCIVNNFIVADYENSGISTNKYIESKDERYIGEHYLECYNKLLYESEYKKYCDNEFEAQNYSEINFTQLKKELKLLKNIKRFKNKKIKITKKITIIFKILFLYIDFMTTKFFFKIFHV